MVVNDIPIVTIDRHWGVQIPCVTSDNFGGGQLAARKLIELGCKRPVFMRIGSSIPSESDKRGAGFENICRTYGVSFDSIVLNDEDTAEPFFRYLEEHIKDSQPDFDGIFCSTDSLASIIITRLRQMGVAIPGQVQVIGYDGIMDFAGDRPVCSTIVQPIREIAEAAVTILLDKERATAPAILSLPVSYLPCGTTRDC